MAASKQKLGVVALVVAVLIVLLLISPSGSSGDQASSQQPETTETTATAAARVAPPAVAPRSTPVQPAQDEGPVDEPRRFMAGGQPFWRPGEAHWYGPKEDPFIFQPHDYEPGTPEILGDAISQQLFDLERVGDMVRRGGEGDSEIAQLRGVPLDDVELQQARGHLQAFFDQTVPVIDAVLSRELSPDQAYRDIGPRRQRLNEALRVALDLSERQFAELWPHILSTR